MTADIYQVLSPFDSYIRGSIPTRRARIYVFTSSLLTVLQRVQALPRENEREITAQSQRIDDGRGREHSIDRLCIATHDTSSSASRWQASYQVIFYIFMRLATESSLATTADQTARSLMCRRSSIHLICQD